MKDRARGIKLSSWFEGKKDATEDTLFELVGDQLEDLKRQARYFSSGQVKTADLRRMGHPYAKRHGRSKSGRFQKHGAAIPYGDAGIINEQSEQFKKAWRVEGPRRAGDTITGELLNDTPYARWLFRKGGTDKMIARPIIAKLERWHKKRWEARVRAAFSRVEE